jgi:hypothetical protein
MTIAAAPSSDALADRPDAANLRTVMLVCSKSREMAIIAHRLKATNQQGRRRSAVSTARDTATTREDRRGWRGSGRGACGRVRRRPLSDSHPNVAGVREHVVGSLARSRSNDKDACSRLALRRWLVAESGQRHPLLHRRCALRPVNSNAAMSKKWRLCPSK